MERVPMIRDHTLRQTGSRRGSDRARLRLLLLACTGAALAWAAAAFAQDVGDDDEFVYSVREAFEAPSDLRSAKRKEARDSGEWTATVAGTVASGYDSNVHESPRKPASASFEYLGMGVEALKYAGDVHRLKLDLDTDGRIYNESVNSNPYRVEGKAFYGYRPNDLYSLGLSATVRRRNDSATTIDGRKLRRDLAHTAYTATGTAWLYPSPHHSLQASLSAQRRDYDETATLPSIDWWKYGPRVEYDYEPRKDLEFEVAYIFYAQNYDEEPSSDRSGFEDPSYPPEEHFLHNATAALAWEISSNADVTLGYRFRRKDDQFQQFESYSANSAEFEAEWTPASRWHLQSSARFEHRAFDNRIGEAGNDLHYDRWTATFTGFYRVWSDLSLYLAYDFDTRDTNAVAGRLTYQDYTRHLVTGGVAVYY